MKRIILIFLLTVPFCWNSLNAQFLGFPETATETSSKKPLTSIPVENVVKNNLFIIQQNYQLKDNTVRKGGYFGRDNKPNFGTVYALGIKTLNGFYTNARAVFPWLYDSYYSDFKEKTQYSPVISSTNYREWNTAAYKQIKFATPQNLPADSLLFVKSKLFKNKGLEPGNGVGVRNGWVVWVVQTSKELPESLSLEYFQMELANSDNIEISANYVSDKIIIGGLYVTQLGQSSVELTGLVSRNNNKWFVKKILGKGGSVSSGNASVSSDGLTPVGSSSGSSSGSRRNRRNR
jgi:hypothetical protein